MATPNVYSDSAVTVLASAVGPARNAGVSLHEISALAHQMDEADLPRLRAALAEADSIALFRLATAARAIPVTAPKNDKWINVEQAAAIASVPGKRIYEWARHQKWASRPTKRCLRINEVEFRRWLAGTSGRL